MNKPSPFLVAAVLSIVGEAASAKAIDAGAICTSGAVDRLKLADAILDDDAVPRALQAQAKAPAGAPAGLPTDELVFLDRSLCQDADRCSAGDIQALNQARNHLGDFMRSPPKGVSNPARLRADAVFIQADVALPCAPPAPPGAQTPAKTETASAGALSAIRVRGNASSFYIPRDGDGYDGVAKATVSLQDDGVAHKRTEKVVLFMGYDIQASPAMHVIPYAGIDQELSRTNGQKPSISSDFWQTGVQASWYVSNSWLGQSVDLRPDFLANMQDHSQIASLNLTYVPYVIAGSGRFPLNDYIGLTGGSPIRLQPVFEVRANVGHYLDRGLANVAGHTDFQRLGPKYGVVLAFDTFKDNPMVLTVTDVHLFRLGGAPKDVDYLSSDLSIPLGDSKIFSLDLIYTNGRREDSLARENTWGISLGAKY